MTVLPRTVLPNHLRRLQPTAIDTAIIGTVAACALGFFSTASAAAGFDEEVVVTATRTPLALNDALSAVTAIDRTELNALQPLDLVDVFSHTPSLDISRSGGPGSATSLYTRGTASGHTLILVDGQRVSSATLGSTNIQFLNPDQFERVEIVRGAGASLYGSEAIGGVIQVFTRDGSGEPDTYINTAIGSNHLHKVALGSSSSNGNWRYGVHASYLETDGIDNLVDDRGNNADRDGYRNRSINASLGYRFDNGVDIALRYLDANTRNEYDSAYSPSDRPYSDSRLQNLNLQVNVPVTRFWHSKLSVGQSIDDGRDYEATAGIRTGDFRTKRQQFFWQNDITLADGHVLTLGYDYYDDEVDSASSYYVDAAGNHVSARDNSALFAQYQGQWSQFDVVLGLREDDNEEFGKQTTGNAALGYNIDANHKVVASWSEGFKAPTFNDLYWPADPYTAGNPDLEPESSENSELSLRGNYARWGWSLAYFENDVDNLIDWAPGTDFVFRPYNVSTAEIRGGELTLNATVADWQLDAAYTYLEPRDGDTDTLLVNRSRNNLVLNASRAIGQLQLAFSAKVQSKRYTDTANTSSLGGYATFDLRLGYQVTDKLETTFKLENLFDRDYQLNDGYNQDARNWQVGLTYRL